METIHQAIRLLNENELMVVSTDRQIKNDTIMVEDIGLCSLTSFGTNYTIHATGYARKRVNENYYRGKLRLNHYQLNKTTKLTYENRKFTDGYPEVFSIQHTSRILLPGKYVQLAQMVVNAANRERK